MKSFVCKESLKMGLVIAGVVLAISALLQPSLGVFYLVFFAVGALVGEFRLGPEWMRKSPLGRWLRR